MVTDKEKDKEIATAIKDLSSIVTRLETKDKLNEKQFTNVKWFVGLLMTVAMLIMSYIASLLEQQVEHKIEIVELELMSKIEHVNDSIAN